MRVAAYLTYLAAWLTLAIAAAHQALTKFGQPKQPIHLTAPTIIGTLLQFAGALAITLSMEPGRLNPPAASLVAVLTLSPLAVALFLWTLRSQGPGLVTTGAYGKLRHPLYLTFLLMLLATGLLVTTWPRIAAAALLYLMGSELRLAAEEQELAEAHPEYANYKQQTPYRYLPLIR
jgi:protein-S-isoprenylcysteine O-methyltransferase Ste14